MRNDVNQKETVCGNLIQYKRKCNFERLSCDPDLCSSKKNTLKTLFFLSLSLFILFIKQSSNCVNTFAFGLWQKYGNKNCCCKRGACKEP